MKKKINEFIRVFSVIVIVNILFSIFVLSWATDDDINGLPPLLNKNDKNNNNIISDRLITLFYYGISTFTTTGYGDVYAKSSRMKILMSLYMILVVSASASFLFNF
jgi:hypothetical protein